MSETFRCYRCLGVFKRGPEKDATEEYLANFPGASLEERGEPICTKCYEDFWKWAKTNVPELKRTR